jgi:hypothetical protein
MTLQHHFVVVVEDGKPTLDHDTTMDRFYNGTVWNDEIQDWEESYDWADEYTKAQELLWDRLNFGYDYFTKNLLDTIAEMRSTGDYDEDTLEGIEWRIKMPDGEDRILPWHKEQENK